jgi:hypothetical protein
MDKTENKTVETTANGTAPRTANFGNGQEEDFKDHKEVLVINQKIQENQELEAPRE